MSKLIALVPTAVLVDGVRTVIQPGQELPALNPHDAAALVASGAAEDPAKTAAQARTDAVIEQYHAAEFEAARARVLAEQASTEPAAAVPAKAGKK